ncbi:MAG TPA: hypothetical protein VI728_13120, partial [Syntrophales bacterium]|nr:hypothetical protein [Syntrophales bacterium]
MKKREARLLHGRGYFEFCTWCGKASGSQTACAYLARSSYENAPTVGAFFISGTGKGVMIIGRTFIA